MVFGIWSIARRILPTSQYTLLKKQCLKMSKDLKTFFLFIVIASVLVIIAFAALYFFMKNTQKQMEDQFLSRLESMAQESTETKHQLDEKIALLEQQIVEMEKTISEIKNDAASVDLTDIESDAALELEPVLERGKMEGVPPTETGSFGNSRGE